MSVMKIRFSLCIRLVVREFKLNSLQLFVENCSLFYTLLWASARFGTFVRVGGDLEAEEGEGGEGQGETGRRTAIAEVII